MYSRAFASWVAEVSNQEMGEHSNEAWPPGWIRAVDCVISCKLFLLTILCGAYCILLFVRFFPLMSHSIDIPVWCAKRIAVFTAKRRFSRPHNFQVQMVFMAKRLFTATWLSRPIGFCGQIFFTATVFFHGLLSKLHLAIFFGDKRPPRMWDLLDGV